MGAKNNDETVKYNLMCDIRVEGTVSEADIVGALFGQTEGLISDMDLKLLQKSGRVGRINLDVRVHKGVTKGKLVVPSSLNKIETAILAATLESVDRVGPCACNISLDKIVDVRKSKRDEIQKRASEIMKKWEVETRENTKVLSKKVERESQKGRVIIFGTDALPAGPEIYQATEILLVEGRADVINLMEMGINNTIALQGTNVPKTIKNLSKTRTITALLDGDRGGDMILKELAIMGKIEFVARAPYKREVEDLNHDEIMKILDEKVPMADAVFVMDKDSVSDFLSKGDKDYKAGSPVKFTGKSTRGSKSPPSSRDGRGSRMDDQSSSRDNQRTSRRDDRRSSNRDDRRSSSRDDRRPSHNGGQSRNTSPNLFSSRGNRREERGSRGRRPSDRDRNRRRIEIPKGVLTVIEKTKQTFKAVLLGKSDKTLVTVKTSEVYNTLADLDGVESIILDGVITQRLLDLANDKSVKLIAGAAVGEITSRPRDLQYTTFNRI